MRHRCSGDAVDLGKDKDDGIQFLRWFDYVFVARRFCLSNSQTRQLKDTGESNTNCYFIYSIHGARRSIDIGFIIKLTVSC